MSCKTDISRQIANKEKILADISNIDSLKMCYSDDLVYESEYICKDVEIVKRQTNKENKEDFVFCNLVMENDYFRTCVQAELTYNYYDQGGWILDEYIFNIQEVMPIRAPEYELVVELLKEDFGYIYFTPNGEYYNYSLENVETYLEKDVEPAKIKVNEYDGSKSSEYEAQVNFVTGFPYFEAYDIFAFILPLSLNFLK